MKLASGAGFFVAFVGLLAGFSSCSEAEPGTGLASGAGEAPASAGSEITATDDARRFFDSACASCHEEGAGDCFLPEHFVGGRLGGVFEEVTAHDGVPLSETMRRSLRPYYLREVIGR